MTFRQRLADVAEAHPRAVAGVSFAGYVVVGSIAAMMSWWTLLFACTALLLVAGGIRLIREVRAGRARNV